MTQPDDTIPHSAGGAEGGAFDAGDPRPVFIEMFEAVRAYLLSAHRSPETFAPVATNPKGEATRGFDANAERIALEVARRRLGAFRALSEEAGALTVGDTPRWTLILDPCDGSNNYKRGIRMVGFAVAALPVDAPLDPTRVEYAVCGDVFTGAVYSAARGRGATLDGAPLAVSRTRELRHAMLSVNIGRDRSGAPPVPPERVWRAISEASTIRRTGATILDLCYVAQGAVDAYVDVRQRLTPENFLAPALLLAEAGGRLTDHTGRPLGPVEFTQPYNVLATGSAELLDALVTTLGADRRAI